MDTNGVEQRTETRKVTIKVIRYGTVNVADDRSDSEVVFDLESMQYNEIERYLQNDFDVEVL